MYMAWYVVHSTHILPGRSDVLVGYTTSRRAMPCANIETVIGPVVNTLPLRLHFPESSLAIEAALALHRSALENGEHEWMPLGQLQEALGRRNMFDTVLDVQQDVWSCPLGPGVEMHLTEYIDMIGAPLSMRVLCKPQSGLQLTLQSETSACGAKQVHVLLDAFLAALSSVAEDSTITVGQLRSQVSASRPLAGIPESGHEAGQETMVTSQSSDESGGYVHDVLRECLSEVLGHSTVPSNANLFSSGLDSLRSLRLTAIAMRRGLQLTIRDIFQHPTLSGLAAHIAATRDVSDDALSSSKLFAVKDPSDERSESFFLTGITKAYWTGLWHNPYSPKGCFPQIAFEFDWEGELVDAKRLSECFDLFVQRHASFRAVVVRDSPMMRYLSEEEVRSVAFSEETLSENCDVEAACDAAYHAIFDAVIDPFTFPLFRGHVVHLPSSAGGGSRFFYCVSLFIMDGITDLTWRHEISQLYQRRELPKKPALTYKAYSEGYLAEGTGIRSSRSWKEAAAYWQRRVQEHLPLPPQLPLLNEATTNRGTFSHFGDAPLKAHQLKLLKDRAAHFGLTPTAVLLALYALALARHAASSTMLINVLHCLRHPVHEDCETVLGNFSSSFLCPVNAAGSSRSTASASILIAAKAAMEALVECQAQNTISGVDVMSMVNSISEEPGRPAAPFIFVSALGLESAVPEWQDLCFTERRVTESTSGTFMVHAVKEYPDGSLYAGFNVIDGAFAEETIAAVVRDHRLLLDAVVDEELAAWEALVPSLLEPIAVPAPLCCQSHTEIAGEETLIDGLLRAEAGNPTQSALVDAEINVVFSYAEVLGRAGKAAAALVLLCPEMSATQDEIQLVAVASEKGWAQVVSCLAILLVGSAYLPLNMLAWPQLRVEAVLEAGKAAAIMASASSIKRHSWLQSQPRPLLEVESSLTNFPSQRSVRQHPQASGRLAYCIFTSGSTGRPKGVAMSHSGALNTIKALCSLHNLGSDLVTLGVSQLAFDLSVSDIFLTFHASGMLVLPPEESLSPPTPAEWLALAEKWGVTLWNSVPALFGLLCEHCELFQALLPSSVTQVWLSGDMVPEALPSRALALTPSSLRMFAMGGATEAGIWSNLVEITYHRPQDGLVPYGNALPGQGMHVIRLEDLQPAAPGVHGMIAITGGSLMLGYYKDERLTGDAIVMIDGERTYLTQDAGYTRRRASDGELEIIITGRIQGNQGGYVKVRGFRVELQEVESALRSLANVSSAAAIAPDKNNIAAYVVLSDSSLAMTEQLRLQMDEKLADILPSYALPRWIIPLEQMPLSSNGKVDKGALPKPKVVGTEMQTASASQPTVLEASVLAAAKDIGIQVHTPRDNIFSSGADSVSALRLILRLEALHRVKLHAAAVFNNGCVAAIADAISTASAICAEDMALAELDISVLHPSSSMLSPVFLCHGAGTTALALAPIAAALSESGEFGTVYGISDTFITSAVGRFGYSTVESAALAMANLIQSVGPRIATLGGWSYGAVVAFACARLLQARGVRVQALLLLDAPLGQKGARSLNTDAIQSLQEVVGEDLSHRVATHFEECNRLLDMYEPKVGTKLECPVFDIRPVDSATDYLSATTCRTLTSAAWEHISIPGATHFSMVQARYAKAVGTPPELLRHVRQSHAVVRRRAASLPRS